MLTFNSENYHFINVFVFFPTLSSIPISMQFTIDAYPHQQFLTLLLP